MHTNYRRSFSQRRWLRALPGVAVLCSLALVATAAAAPKGSVLTSVSTDPDCGFVAVSGAWQAVSGQSYVDVSLSENQTGATLSSAPVPVSPASTNETVYIGGSFSPLPSGRHVVRATFTVYDGDFNPITSGKVNANMPCALDTVVLPT
jgi:hypothetical protein